jgi:hypothetical protein
MTDPTYTPDPAAIVSAADVLRAYLQREAPEAAALMFNADFEGAAMALDEAGRLLPADAEREWSIRTADGYVSTVRHTERSARLRAADYGHDNAEPVHRAVGPWLPAPEPTCTCPDCDVSTVGERPGTSTIKGLDPACRIHGKLSVWCACKPGTTCGYHLANPEETP